MKRYRDTSLLVEKKKRKHEVNAGSVGEMMGVCFFFISGMHAPKELG